MWHMFHIYATEQPEITKKNKIRQIKVGAYMYAQITIYSNAALPLRNQN